MLAPWLGERDEGALQKALLLPLGLASRGYSLGARLHRAVYAGGWLAPRRLSCRVVSVGSLLAGGSGKTPVTAWLAGRLRARGYRVVIATRGYGRIGGDAVHTLSDGRRVRGDVVGVGDEPLVLAAHAADVPVLVGRDRGVVGLRAVSSFGADVLVLDDGFQHHRLSRDVDVVTIDGGFGFGNRRILPRGPLREPVSALARAHAVGIIDGPLSEADAALLDQHALNPLVFQARRRAAQLCRIGTPATEGEPATALAGARVGMLAALGQPSAFRRTLEEKGATVIAERSYRDHHRYQARDLKNLGREADVWVTTQKDAAKILPRWVRGIDLRVLTIDLVVAGEDVFLDWLEAQLG